MPLKGMDDQSYVSICMSTPGNWKAQMCFGQARLNLILLFPATWLAVLSRDPDNPDPLRERPAARQSLGPIPLGVVQKSLLV